jgi:hypothetical protein
LAPTINAHPPDLSAISLREFTPADLARLHELHKGQDYELPDPAHPLCIVKECVTADDKIVAVGLGRIELNVTLLLDHFWSTADVRFAAVKQLQEAMHRKASGFGLDQAFAEVPARWGERLKGLGWEAARNPLYYRRID